MPSVQPTLIAINAVIAERADDFEDWLRTIVVPAVRKHRPELQGRWEVLRATEQEDGTATFVFIFHGGDASEWSLEALLTQALGAEGSQRAMADMTGMMKREQYGWTLAPVQL
jgi:prophage antirepressor-like protein